ncbi:hypothetical protein AAHA92_16137 [Salvia divinorum]|uniref:Uncharacterized protein n=1 Tax=Salvia divinorum TaxID=28513 RepID=A0ABD1GYH6_SALDI
MPLRYFLGRHIKCQSYSNAGFLKICSSCVYLDLVLGSILELKGVKAYICSVLGVGVNHFNRRVADEILKDCSKHLSLAPAFSLGFNIGQLWIVSWTGSAARSHGVPVHNGLVAMVGTRGILSFHNSLSHLKLLKSH